MVEHERMASANAPAGLVAGVAGVIRNSLGLLLSRIELAALELSETRNQLLKMLLIAALGILAIWFALAYWTALVVYLTWDSLGWRILLIMASLFSVLSVALLLWARSFVRQGKLSLPSTMVELAADRDALS